MLGAKARDLMKRDFTSVAEDAPLKEAAALLARTHLSGLPVVNRRDEVVGFISERDIVAAAFPESIQTAEVISFSDFSLIAKKLGGRGGLKVKDYLGHKLYSVEENASLREIIDLMLEHNLKRLPVLKGRRLAGIIERSAVSKVAMEEGL